MQFTWLKPGVNEIEGPREFDNLQVANDFLSEARLCDYLVICNWDKRRWNASCPAQRGNLTNLEIDQENEKFIKVEEWSEKFDCPRKIFKASVRRPPAIQSGIIREGFANSQRRGGDQCLPLLRGRM